jgi:hypothetical protein
MLRLVCHVGRRRGTAEDDNGTEETWVEWVQRATRFVETTMRTAGVEPWIVAQRRKKGMWAGHIARMSDGRWTSQALAWEPAHGVRTVGRPMLRWTDCFDQFFKRQWGSEPGSWESFAQSRSDWKQYEDEFCHVAL